MRHLALLISIIALILSKTNLTSLGQSEPLQAVQAPAHKQKNASADTPLQFLINAAATDFHRQHASSTIHFRDVHTGHVMTPDRERQYMLCGQFMAKGKTDWVPFATIKTSGYEQYLGDQAASFCKRPSIKWEKGDLSSSLQSLFDSLQ